MPPPPGVDIHALGPRAAGAALLIARESSPTDGGVGGIDPDNINNNAVFAVFGVLGAAFVIVGIWFFFWAKEGGFFFEENDWEEYKSTVMRRKGPNGTLLSGATASTRLGGGSVYRDVEDDAATAVSGLTGITGITPGASDVGGRNRHRKRKEVREQKRRAKQFEKERRTAAMKTGRHVGEDGVLVDEEAEKEAEQHLRSYQDERPARVGGLNVQSEASTWDGSTNPSDSVLSSELLSDRQSTPTREKPRSKLHKKMASRSEASGTTGYYTEDVGMTEVSASTATTNTNTTTTTTTATATTTPGNSRSKSPTKPPRAAGGIRKVYSTADRNSHREQERIRAEARRLQEKGRGGGAPSRRDFSYQRADVPRLEPPAAAGIMRSVAEESQSMLGSERETTSSRVHWVDDDETNDGMASEVGTEIGTKAYHHPIPELTVSSLSGGSGVAGSSTVSSNSAYVDERRKQRRGERERAAERNGGTGYRRERRQV